MSKYQYNNKELNSDFGLLWSDYGARWLDLQRGVWGQIDPLAEKYYGWSGYNYVLNNPIKLLDKDGRKPDNYYINEKGQFLAVVRTDPAQADRFYTVQNDNTVIRTPNDVDHQKADPWQRATDHEKRQAVTTDKQVSNDNEGRQVNSEGLNTKQQGDVSVLTTTTNGAARAGGSSIATGTGLVNGAPVVGAILSSNGGNNGVRIVTTASPIDPSRADPNGPGSAPIPQNPGLLPTPDVGDKAVVLPSNALPANLTTTVYRDAENNTFGGERLTGPDGLIPKK